MTTHPVQPLVRDADGIIRFKPNKIIVFLMNTSKFDLNDLLYMEFSAEDYVQLAQLMGNSLKYLSELPYVTDEDYIRAESQEVH